MGINVKEKLKNIDKKFISMTTLFILVAIVFGIGGYEYSRYEIIAAHKKMMAERQKKIEEMQSQTNVKRPSDYTVGIPYEQAKKSDKPVLVLFYADWCRFCIRFMPIFEEISKKYDGQIVFSKVNVEDPKYEKEVKEAEISGFPTVVVKDFKYNDTRSISNTKLYDVPTLTKELDHIVEMRKLLDTK